MSILKSLTRWLNRPPKQQSQVVSSPSNNVTISDPIGWQDGIELAKEVLEVDENREQLRLLSEYVKALPGRKLKDPDFMSTGSLSNQWCQGYGDTIYYQLPNRKVIAVRHNGKVRFNPEGINLGELYG